MVVLRLFWLGVIEATRPELSPSFFQIDLAPAILRFMGCDEIPSPLDPPTLGSLHRDGDNTVRLVPPTLGSESLHRGDSSPPLAPGFLGVLSDDTFPPLIPEVSGVLGRGGTSPPLAPEILRASRHGDTSPPLAPEILGGLSDDTSPPLISEVPGVLGRDDTPPTLAPEILRPLPRRRRDTPYPRLFKHIPPVIPILHLHHLLPGHSLYLLYMQTLIQQLRRPRCHRRCSMQGPSTKMSLQQCQVLDHCPQVRCREGGDHLPLPQTRAIVRILMHFTTFR